MIRTLYDAKIRSVTNEIRILSGTDQVTVDDNRFFFSGVQE